MEDTFTRNFYYLDISEILSMFAHGEFTEMILQNVCDNFLVSGFDVPDQKSFAEIINPFFN